MPMQNVLSPVAKQPIDVVSFARIWLENAVLAGGTL